MYRVFFGSYVPAGGPQVFNETGSGGVVCGGTGSRSVLYRPTPTGGVRVGGTSSRFIIFRPAVTGGAVCGGLGINRMRCSCPSSGGVVCGGEGELESLSETGHLFEKRITHTSEDGVWRTPGNTFSTALCNFGLEGPPWAIDQDVNAFYRFADVDLPQGAIINSARLRFTALTTRSETTVNVTIRAHDIDSGSAPLSAFDAEGFAKTSATVNWNNVAGTTANATFDSPEIKSVVQEIVDRAGWVPLNRMTMFVENNGSTTGVDTFRKPYDYSDDSAKAALLRIWWSTTWNNTASGGVKIGGTSPSGFIHKNIASGGVRISGVSRVSSVETKTTSGGVRAGGVAVVSLVRTVSVGGGVRVAGHAPEAIQVDVGGGIVVGGSSKVNWAVHHKGSGGVKVSSPPFPNRYFYRRAVVVPEGEAIENLSGFILGVIITAPQAAHAEDFLVTTESGATLAREIRQYVPLTGRTHIFFRCDLRADADNVFFIYWRRDNS